MLDTNLVSIGRLRPAFALDDRDVEELLDALHPDHVHPYELWRRAHEQFWRDALLRTAGRRGFPVPALPEHVPEAGMSFLKDCCMALHEFLYVSIALRTPGFFRGLEFIYERAYEEITGTIYYERKLLFALIDVTFRDTVPYDSMTDYEDVRKKAANLFFGNRADGFLLQFFPHSVVVDRDAALRRLDACGYFQQREVKGLSRAIVERILRGESRRSPDISDAPEVTADAGVTVSVPSALWAGRRPDAVRDAMRAEGYGDEVIAHVLHAWCGQSKTAVGALIADAARGDSACRKRCGELLARAAGLDIRGE